MTTKKTNRRIIGGTVISDKMQKTRVVEAVQVKKHPKYGKFYKKFKKYKIHDEKNESHLGDKVEFIECRPMSKEKRFSLYKIVEKADRAAVEDLVA